jgi:hypothetical protein
VNDYRVTQAFAWEAKLYDVGHILRAAHPVEARIIAEWPWQHFFEPVPTGTREPVPTGTRAPARRKPKRDWLDPGLIQ